uniref:TGF-beta family profile domain-containing protein n=1 Tax=Salarias fasciatus TaxID=181472 RepID=A0A672IY83_SALFA
MMAVFALCSLLLSWSRLCVALQVPDRQTHGPIVTGQTLCDSFMLFYAVNLHFYVVVELSSTIHPNTPCFVDNVFAVLRDVGNGGELTNSSSTLFGLCITANNSMGSVLLELAEEIRRNQRGGPEVLFSTAAMLVSEGGEQGGMVLTFDLPQLALLKLNPVLLLSLESPLKGENLVLTFSGESLEPISQTACISGETQYVLLTGKPPEGKAQQKLRISVEATTHGMKQNLKDSLSGGRLEGNISMTLLLLFSGETGTDTRHAHVSGPSPVSLQTSFLCELKRFLGVILPQESSQSPLVQLDSLRSLPPLMLGLSSSETLLAGMINSSAPTVFSFNSWGSTFPVHQEQLALSPPLLEELRQRLEEIVPEIMEMIKEEKLTDKATERLRRLQRLSVWKETELAAGEQQYCAFLLLKALQTVAHAYDLQRRLRATRAQPSNPVMGNVCGLRSLTVSFERVLVGPNTANINNCHGSCAFPLTNANNHAVQLNYHIESGHTDERAPCCVPVAYEGLEVMELDQHGTYISTKPDVIAKECGCR